MAKRFRATIFILGLFAFLAFGLGSSLYWYPNRDDHAASVLRRAGAKVRRRPRLSSLSILTQAEIFPYGDVWDLELNGVEISCNMADNMRSLRSLEILDITNCRIADSCTDLGPSENSLSAVWITNSNVGDRNLGFIAGSRNLWSLIFENTDVSDASIPTILSCSSLTHIVLVGNKFSQDGIERIRAAFPRANVQVEHRSVSSN